MTPTQSAAAANPLPSGTVTFLFTDIEGSTRLWETQAAAMRAALARHDALLRDCIDDHDGHVFKTGGDAFCAAFHTASDALAAALEAHRAFPREPWPVQRDPGVVYTAVDVLLDPLHGDPWWRPFVRKLGLGD
jgi:class 3 adenylate cyclase